MASFTAGTTFVDGVSNDVTAAKLAALVNNATPTSGLIQDRTAETVVATNDTFLIGDASDSNTLKRMTVANVMKAELTGTINTTAGTITTLTAGTTTSTAATITTGTIPTLTSITKITSGTGTAAAPAISPTGDTNTGIFFPAADTVAFSEGGTEAMRIDSSGNVGIGTTSPTTKLEVAATNTDGDITALRLYNNRQLSAATKVSLQFYADNDQVLLTAGRDGLGTSGNFNILTRKSGTQTSSLYIDETGDVGIGTTSPAGKLDVYDATSCISILKGDATVNAVVNRASADIAAPALQMRKSRGSVASPAAVAAGDALGNINFQAFGGANNRNLSRISSSVETYVSDADISSNLTFLTSPAGGVTATERMRIDSSGNVGIGTTSPVNKLDVIGSFGRGAPVTKTADFTLAATENWIIVNKATTSCTATLPTASSWTGREFTIKTLQALTVVSASANVVPINSTSAGTAILPATSGAWATLVSDGTNWVTMAQ